jgi:hypothetical protein
MKRLTFYIAVAATVFAISCTEVLINSPVEEEALTPVVPEQIDTLTISNKLLVFDCSQNTYTLAVNVNCDYDIIIPVDWVSKINTKAMCSDSITLSISANHNYYKRECDIIIQTQDSILSDTIHITQDEGYESLRKLIKSNTDCSIFYQALHLTGLEDSLIAFIDESYPSIDYEWTYRAVLDGDNHHTHITSYETDFEVIPELRLFKFTAFIVPDSFLVDEYYIHNVDELREFAKTVYNDPSNMDLDDKDRNSPLNKLISYHILPCWLTYDQLNAAQTEIVRRYYIKEKQDIEDFYETLMPHSVMRISSAYSGHDPNSRIGIFINRKGTAATNLVTEGVEILSGRNGEYKDNMNMTLNGIYHYITKLLLYDDFTRNHTLECRMRFMANTLSPDFINSGGRGRLYTGETPRITYKYLPGYCTNVELINQESEFFVRYRDPMFPFLNGEDMTIKGNYDLAFKIPPVPVDATYEIRYHNFSLAATNVQDRGVVQFYICERSDDDAASPADTWNWQPCGDPVDFRLSGYDSITGWVRDNEYDQCEDKDALIAANDSLMRSLGYMKGPDCYGNSRDGGYTLRDDANFYRKIICARYFRSDRNYYIRIQKADDDPGTVCMFNCVEIVPKSIYAGHVPEDKH